MGSGTDILKDTASMIVIDDRFSAIVAGVKEIGWLSQSIAGSQYSAGWIEYHKMTTLLKSSDNTDQISPSMSIWTAGLYILKDFNRTILSNDSHSIERGRFRFDQLSCESERLRN